MTTIAAVTTEPEQHLCASGARCKMPHVPAIGSQHTCPQCHRAVHGVCGIETNCATTLHYGTTCFPCADQQKQESVGHDRAVESENVRPPAGLKRGPKTGAKRVERNREFWYSLCSKYRSYPAETRPKIGHFLASEESGESVSCTGSERVSFGRYLKEFDSGTLKPVAAKRRRKSKFILLEQKLANYIRSRQQVFREDNVKMSWTFLRNKLLEWRDSMDDPAYANFAASPGFIAQVVYRNGLGSVNLEDGSAPQDEDLRLNSDPEEVQTTEEPVATDVQNSTVSMTEAEAAQQTLMRFAKSEQMDETFKRSIERIGLQIRRRKMKTQK